MAMLLLIPISCADPPFEFIDGPETSDLIQQVNGYLVVNETVEYSVEPHPKLIHDPRVVTTKLPELTQQIILTRNTSEEHTYSIAGPDRNRMIAFIEGYRTSHALKTIKIDGSNEKIECHGT